MRASGKTQTYTTSDWDGDGKGPPTDPVIAIRRLPAGPTYLLSELRERAGRRHWIFIGRDDARCDLVLTESDDKEDLAERDDKKKGPTVNEHHCSVSCSPEGRVFIKHASGRNRTKVNGTRVHRGVFELSPDDVVRLGKVRLAALNRSGLEEEHYQPKSTARRPSEYFRRAVGVHIDVTKAAKALREKRRTLARWINGGRFSRK